MFVFDKSNYSIKKIDSVEVFGEFSKCYYIQINGQCSLRFLSEDNAKKAVKLIYDCIARDVKVIDLDEIYDEVMKGESK